MVPVNPYQPPTSSSPTVARKPARRFVGYLVPATLSVGLTLLLWAVTVPIIDGITGHRFGMTVWAVMLFLSASISTFAINRLWLTDAHPLAFAFAFFMFGFVFCLLEGDTSNGTDYVNMTIVYGTLLTVPIAMYFLALWTVPNGREIPEPDQNG